MGCADEQLQKAKADIREIIKLTDEYMNDVSSLYSQEPKRYIERVGISQSKLIKKLREQKQRWENTM